MHPRVAEALKEPAVKILLALSPWSAVPRRRFMESRMGDEQSTDDLLRSSDEIRRFANPTGATTSILPQLAFRPEFFGEWYRVSDRCHHQWAYGGGLKKCSWCGTVKSNGESAHA
jgi:hypothetical protein